MVAKAIYLPFTSLAVSSLCPSFCSHPGPVTFHPIDHEGLLSLLPVGTCRATCPMSFSVRAPKTLSAAYRASASPPCFFPCCQGSLGLRGGVLCSMGRTQSCQHTMATLNKWSKLMSKQHFRSRRKVSSPSCDSKYIRLNPSLDEVPCVAGVTVAADPSEMLQWKDPRDSGTR